MLINKAMLKNTTCIFSFVSLFFITSSQINFSKPKTMAKKAKKAAPKKKAAKKSAKKGGKKTAKKAAKKK
jgi:hypothetical protein